MNVLHRFVAGYAGERKPTRRAARAFALAALVIAADCLGQGVKAEEKILAENAFVKLTLADYEAELLLRVPPESRVEFAASSTRLTGFLNTLLVNMTLAKQARAAG